MVSNAILIIFYEVCYSTVMVLLVQTKRLYIELSWNTKSMHYKMANILSDYLLARAAGRLNFRL